MTSMPFRPFLRTLCCGRPPSLLLYVLTVAIVSNAAGQSLQVDVEELIRKSPIDNALTSVSVRDASSSLGAELVNIDSERGMIPASNMKLLTTGAALHVLGSEFTFRTRMLLDGSQLTIVGDGDPAFGDPELLEAMQVGETLGLDVETFIQLLVDPIVASGVDRLEAVVVDDRIFDRDFVHESWPIEQLNARSFAEVAGFNFHRNLIRFYLKPVANGRADARDMRPDMPWMLVRNRTTSHTGTDESNTAWVSRKHMTNDMTLRGNVRSSVVLVPVTVHDMPHVFAELLADRLRAHGIEVDHAGAMPLDAPNAAGEPVGPVVATPLSTIVEVCNRSSQNLYAESLVKRIAHSVTNQPGTWEAGCSVIRHVVLDRIEGEDGVSELFIADGSGLSRNNRIAPSVMSAWLTSLFNDEELARPFLDSLAIARETGTLDRRFHQTKLHGATVRAKTGFINRVSCLSGYVEMPDGHCRAFSIMMNNLRAPGSVAQAKRLQEQIVGAIAADLAAKSDLVQFGGG